MAKIKVPDGTFEDSLHLDTERPFPSIQCLNKIQIGELEERVNRIIDFQSSSRLSYQAINFIGNWISKSGFEELDFSKDKSPKEKKYFYKDPWEKSSMIAVHEGERPITDGFRLIISHADAPCLRIKPRPVRLEWDPDETYNFLGVRLSTIPHGGIVIPHWIGQPVDVIGYTIKKNGSRKELKFQGFIGVNSAHVDYSSDEPVKDAFSPDKSLEIITGFSSIPNLLDALEFESYDDFANTQLWAVPTHQMFPVSEYDWNLLVGYGHDPRTALFSTIDAISRIKNPEYTSIVWVNNDEEIGDPSPTGVDGPFFENVLEKILERQEKKEKRKIPNTEKNNMYIKSKIIISDIDIAPYGKDANNMDFESASKIGLGVSIEGGDIKGCNPKLMRDLRSLAIDNKICHQVCGEVYLQDKHEVWYTGGTYFGKKGTPEINIGIPCASSHSLVEVICPGDEYATSELDRKFFESKKI